MTEIIQVRDRPDTTFADLPSLASARYGDRPLARDDRSSVSYADLDRQSARFAGALEQTGVKPGDRVALWMTNRVEWLIAQFGVYRAGACLVPVNTQFKADELAHVLADSGASVLVYEDRFLGHIDARSVLSAARASDADVRLHTVVCLGDPQGEERPFSDCLANDSPRTAGVAPREPVNIMYTSGTTGLPKGVELSSYGLLTTYSYVVENLSLSPGASSWLIIVPMSTMFGCVAILLPTVLAGGSFLLRPRFDPDDAIATITEARPTHVAGSPAMYELLLASEACRSADFSSVHGGIVAGAVAPPRLLNALIDDVGISDLVNMFGQTEGCGTASMTRPRDPREKRLHTVGRPLPHVELAIGALDGSGHVAAGIEGEVLGRGRWPGVHTCLGYHGQPQRTAEVVDSDGWLHYGDIGALDDDGYLRVGAGRLKEMYVSGGYNVYPSEVEQILARHPQISRVAVAGVPDDRLGEVGLAYVEVAAGASLTEAELASWCKEHLSHYKAPKWFAFGTDFPVTASGKIKRLELRDRWLDAAS